ncbi:hypothetical protein [Streptomyces sp. NPDC051079]|uniref:hypothetical protein n=1 Tax=Streptomyces sp. NPDC051079 TaxID=3155043 RepID=UPI00344EE010
MAYDPDSGWLTVCPASSAWATQARLEQTRVITAANQAAGRTVVSSPRILPPGAAPVPRPGRCCPGRSGPGRTHRSGQDPGDGMRGLPPRTCRAPGSRAAAPGGPGHRGDGGTADRRDAGAVPPGVPRDRRRGRAPAAYTRTSGSRAMPQSAASSAAASPTAPASASPARSSPGCADSSDAGGASADRVTEGVLARASHGCHSRMSSNAHAWGAPMPIIPSSR